ncbi:hypothetical protein [Siminovitchia fortis]|uniref:hypothetical protein n=1 Tax=Siminovitchia fortis TaxID=254758 RepID=UPI0011A536FC|nr:hypothetical protein [Siminovitchia fortis]
MNPVFADGSQIQSLPGGEKKGHAIPGAAFVSLAAAVVERLANRLPSSATEGQTMPKALHLF